MNDIEQNLVSLTMEQILMRSTLVQRREGRRTWGVRSTGRNVGYIVKFFGETESGFVREVRTLRYLGRASSAFRTPILIRHGVLPGTSTAFVVMEELNGRTLDWMMQNGSCERSEAFFLIGRVLSEFHELAPPGGIRGEGGVSVGDRLIAACETHIRILKSRGELKVAKWARCTRRRIERSTYTTDGVVFCHGDLHPKNLLVNLHDDSLPSASGLVDFESVRIETRECDVAKSIVVAGAIEQADIASILKGYGYRELDEEMLAIYQAFHAINGWVYGGLIERRDRALWEQRVLRYTRRLQA